MTRPLRICINSLSVIFIVFFSSVLKGSDSQFLQDLINTSHTGKIIRLQSSRVYLLDSPIKLRSNITVDGNGCTVKAARDWGLNNDRFAGLFELVNVSNIQIRNIKFDLEGTHRSPTHRIHTTMLLLGAENCHLSDVIFVNSGFRSSNQLPNSPHLLLLSRDKAQDFNYIPREYMQIFAATKNNIIENCRFINDSSFSSFGIRILSDWYSQTSLQDYVHKTENNTVLNCQFLGGFEWNAIELAGGGTVGNKIIGNHLTGKTIHSIDIDKGASYNLVRGNNIINTGLPIRWNSRNDVRCSAIIIHGSSPRYLSVGNVVSQNIIRKVFNIGFNSRFTFSGGITVSNATDTRIVDNVINDLYNAEYGGAIVLDQEISNIFIGQNRISGCHWGIIFTPNSRYLKNLQIEENIISSRNSSICLVTKQAGEYSIVAIIANKIEAYDRSVPAVYAGDIEQVSIEGNEFHDIRQISELVKIKNSQSVLKDNYLATQ